MKKKAMQAMNLLKSNDKSHKYRNEQLKNALMSPYAPITRRAGRSSSFHSEINNSSMPFSSIAMSRSSFERQKKNKLGFLNKLKIGKEKKHRGDRLIVVEDVIEEEQKEV
jgi:hypothetical protein